MKNIKNCKYMTVYNMRFYLRLLGIKNIHKISDQSVVNMYNKFFIPLKNVIGINDVGKNIVFNKKK